MDVLSNILDAMHFNACFYFSTHFRSPWGLEVPAYKDVARFHFVTAGSCWISIEGARQPVELKAGDFIIIPHGQKHIIRDNLHSPVTHLDTALHERNYDGEGVFEYGSEDGIQRALLICGHFEFDESFNHPLTSQLPDHILLREEATISYTWLKDSLKYLAHEINTRDTGSFAAVKRLSEIIFIQAIRAWYHTEGVGEHFISAIFDPKINQSLKAFHSNYSAEWSVEELASSACMSRTQYAEKFKRLTQMTPMQYVTQWRMQHARRHLSLNSDSIERIANDMGYESAAAFSKAFKRHTGCTPGEYRKTHSHVALSA